MYSHSLARREVAALSNRNWTVTLAIATARELSLPGGYNAIANIPLGCKPGTPF